MYTFPSVYKRVTDGLCSGLHGYVTAPGSLVSSWSCICTFLLGSLVFSYVPKTCITPKLSMVRLLDWCPCGTHSVPVIGCGLHQEKTWMNEWMNKPILSALVIHVPCLPSFILPTLHKSPLPCWLDICMIRNLYTMMYSLSAFLLRH